MIHGLDVSHWQGQIDWPSVRGDGFRFAFLKATDGLVLADGSMFEDSTYGPNRKYAQAAGLLTGPYHFARPSPSTKDAEAEAAHFISVTHVPITGDLPWALDLETASSGITVAEMRAWVRAFCTKMISVAPVGLLYVSPSFYTKYLGGWVWPANHGIRLWVAHWGVSKPSVPANNWNGGGWTFWQTTSSGSVHGIRGRVDLDQFAGTMADLRTLANAPTGDDMATYFISAVTGTVSAAAGDTIHGLDDTFSKAKDANGPFTAHIDKRSQSTSGDTPSTAWHMTDGPLSGLWVNSAAVEEHDIAEPSTDCSDAIAAAIAEDRKNAKIGVVYPE